MNRHLAMCARGGQGKSGFAILLLTLMGFGVQPIRAQSCTSNPIVCENALPGAAPPTWQIDGDGDPSIQGFATDISVNAGGVISFKVNTNASNYTIDIFRMGYYQGNGARHIDHILPSATLPQTQPACLTDVSTNLYDCGNWAVSASWAVPSTAVSGLYIALLTRPDTGAVSQMFFVVRNDASHSAILLRTSDETWAAYNDFGGHSLYGPSRAFDLTNRAYKVSYNRPFDTRNFEAATFLYNAEYPLLRWLEMNGYDVSYFTSVDAARNGTLIQNHKIFISSGHDEYISGPHRDGVQAARDAGVNMAFFSGNEFFWKTRWENSIDGANTPYRTLVCYKETLANTPSTGIFDPQDPPTWTGTWRDARFSPPADGGHPENALTGTLFLVNGPGTDNTDLSIKVPAADGKMRFWRNTSIATQAPGATATLPAGTLGYEWDVDADNGARPAGLFHLSTSTYNLTTDYLLDNGAIYGAGTATHSLTLYRAPSGALVFGAGTVQWAWGLDANHDGSGGGTSAPMQQATVNLFADMGVQPGTLQAGLIPAAASTDGTPPTSTITSPAAGAVLTQGVTVNITGTATDTGGGVVGGVEVSTDGGKTWHPAVGRGSWSYSWAPASSGPATLLSRAVDDSANLEIPGAGVGITVPHPPISLDAQASGDNATQTSTVSTSNFSTTASNELLLAYVSGDYLGGANTTVTGVAGAGLTWTLVLRTNTQSGTSEIWRAFAPSILSSVKVTATLSQNVYSSISVTTFSGVNTSGTNGSGAIGAVKGANARSGGPTASLVTTQNESWIFGVGNDYDDAIPRTPGAAQTLVHQTLTPSGDTLWVQMQNGPTPQSGTTVSINDTAPTGDRYNLSIVEVLPVTSMGTTYSLSGAVTPASSGTGTTLSLSGAASGSAMADAAGNFTFSNLANGVYTVTPAKSGFTFSPTSQQVTIASASKTGISFTATPVPVTYSISGTVSPAASGSGTSLTLSGSASATTTADASGNYAFANLSNGSYTITPTKSSFAFAPLNQAVTINNANVTSVNFAATSTAPTYSISGTISPAASGSGTSLALTGAATGSAVADASGNFSFANLSNGSYTVTPSKSGFSFTPSSQTATVSNGNVAAMNFSAQASTLGTLAIDANTSADGSAASLTVKTGTFSTTAGNELLLAFVETDYLTGTNTKVNSIAGGGLTWVLVQRTNAQPGSAEIWRAFSPAPLAGATVTATLSNKVVASITVMSFSGVDTSGVSGSGAIGATKSASSAKGAPSASLTTTRAASWVIGVGNDFDNGIARTLGTGQTMVHQVLTAAGDTYWVQKRSATTPVSGTAVTINDTAPTTDSYNLALCEILAHP